jgi:hypothetical protein
MHFQRGARGAGQSRRLCGNRKRLNLAALSKLGLAIEERAKTGPSDDR